MPATKKPALARCPPKPALRDWALLSPETANELMVLYKVLANDTRLRLLHALVRADELCVTELAEKVDGPAGYGQSITLIVFLQHIIVGFRGNASTFSMNFGARPVGFQSVATTSAKRSSVVSAARNYLATAGERRCDSPCSFTHRRLRRIDLLRRQSRTLQATTSTSLAAWLTSRRFVERQRARKVGIVALARKLLIALWRWLEHGELPEGARLCPWRPKVNGVRKQAA